MSGLADVAADWFDYPTVQMVDGRWELTIPSEFKDVRSSPPYLNALSDLFHEPRFNPSSPLYKNYETQIKKTLTFLRDSGRKFGALMLEPVVLGAGGMILV
jgi:dethiobiotin synthetase/adenosylmethionine--8-amino-7-oxononanoate aminotransferase